MISPYKFTWDGLSSLEFDVFTEFAFDSDDGATETHLSREAVVSETYNGALKRVSGYKWNESFSFQLTLIKNNFGDFTSEENRRILKWLTGRQNAGFINIYKDDSEVVEFAVLGNFINVSSYKLGNGRVVGYVADFESVMPFAMSDLYTVTKRISSATDNKITINIDTDDNKPVYPRITIKQTGSVVRIPDGKTYTTLASMNDKVENTAYFNGTTYYWKSADGTSPISFHASTTNPNLATTSVKLTNTHTDLFNRTKVITPSTIIKNNTNTETVVLDGANKVISSSSVNRVFDDNFVNWTWLPLFDGKNEITIEGNCEITFEWRCVRKIGEF